MISPDLDIAYWARRLRTHGRVQIPGFLQPDAAQRLHECLRDEVRWTLALRDAAGSRTIPADAYAAMGDDEAARRVAEVAAGARDGGFRFAYDSYMMVTAYKERRDPGLLLHRVLEFMHTPEYLGFCRVLTGDARIRRCQAQATRYRPGHFLRQHTDEDASEGRLFAYVINLTPNWQADWGGLLQFIDGDGTVTETFLPRWNSLSLFQVPAGHVVSLVAPWAQQDRFAITGWWTL